MSDDPRIRVTPEARIRPRPRPRGDAPPTPDAAPEPGGEAPSIRTRRSLLIGGAAIIAAAIGVGSLFTGPSELPDPPGQIAGPEYRAATLKLRPAPTMAMPPDHTQWQSCVAPGAAAKITDLDMVLAIDTTSSMGGVINDVKANVKQLIRNLRTGGGSVRVGIVAYRDIGDAYVARPFPLTVLDDQGAAALDAFVSGLQAEGGGDWPEALEVALDVATGMAWRGTVPASIVVIADAPAHQNKQQTAFAIAEAFATKIPGAAVSLIDTGSGANGFMRALPKAGKGQYVTYDGHILNSLLPAITGCASR
jgi:Mg-chelatase subunit ChlD